MTTYFRRLCRVDISPDIRVEDAASISFDIKKSTDSDNNASIVRIYNLSRETKNRIPNDINALVKISAGYEGNIDYVEIGQGNISNVVHESVGTNTITTIYAKDGFKAIRGKRISLSFEKNTTLSTIITTISAELGLPFRFLDYDKTVVFQGGYAYLGSIPGALDELAYQFNFSWSIQNGQLLIINKYRGTKRVGVLLSFNTGLVKNPESVLLNKALKERKRDEYKVTCLLQPQAEVGDYFRIESDTLSGTFIVNELQHRGEAKANDFITEMIVVKNEQ